MSEPSTELIFLGTGTSSSIPHVECLTAPPNRKPCLTCLSTLRPEGKKNLRRNTGAVLRIPCPNDPERRITVLIDAGKTFNSAAVEWFPKYGLRKIDALLITHPHADAFNGLDDLRGWTLNGAIQPHIDIYTSEHTFNQAKQSFPYLVSKEYATGGGDVPEFKWHIVHDKIPFEIENTGIHITPFFVHHGRVFSTPPSTEPSTPKSQLAALSPPKAEDGKQSHSRRGSDQQHVQPYLCLGFKIQTDILYISDVSYIPEDVWPLLTPQDKPYALVLDCLHLRGHSSHFSLEQAYSAASKIKAKRTYLTGFSHNVSHEEYVHITEAFENNQMSSSTFSENERAGVRAIQKAIKTLRDENNFVPIWLRPAHDGLRISITNGEVKDDTYDSIST